MTVHATGRHIAEPYIRPALTTSTVSAAGQPLQADSAHLESDPGEHRGIFKRAAVLAFGAVGLLTVAGGATAYAAEPEKPPTPISTNFNRPARSEEKSSSGFVLFPDGGTQIGVAAGGGQADFSSKSDQLGVTKEAAGSLSAENYKMTIDKDFVGYGPFRLGAGLHMGTLSTSVSGSQSVSIPAAHVNASGDQINTASRDYAIGTVNLGIVEPLKSMDATFEAYGKLGANMAAPSEGYMGVETGVQWNVGHGMSFGPTVEVMSQINNPQNTTGNLGLKLRF